MPEPDAGRPAGLRLPLRLALTAACLLLVIVPPGVALAATQFNYAQGTNGVGGTYQTTGEDNRSYNQVWHQAGKSWWVWYLHGSSQTCLKFNSSNPTKCPDPSATIAYSKCSNYDDNSGVTWTCQTTRP
ncbi:MAG: hypothetical protein OEW52_14050 [Thermoleophilia bacterium]|nr:hypothetical protein [Thermoleophilia bacterium]